MDRVTPRARVAGTELARRVKLPLLALLLTATPGILSGQGAPTGNEPWTEQLRRLVATLQSGDSTHQDKVAACHRLAIVGTKEAVPVLAALLADEKLAHIARHALEPMPDPAAGAALRDALGKTQGMPLVGVINSIGFRRDADATRSLAGFLGSSDEQVAAAAAAALGRIGSPEAATILQEALSTAPDTRRVAYADACLACAEALAADGNRREAAAIYDRLCGAGLPDHVRAAAMFGAIAVREAAGVSLLVQQLESEDTPMLAAAWRAARELSGSYLTEALADGLPKLAVETQARLIQLLGDRGDKTALPAVLAAADRGAPEVRLAAIKALPRVDEGGSSRAILLRAITAGQRTVESDAALVSLGQIGGGATDATILAALPAVVPAMRARLIGVLGVRRAESARGELMKQAASGDADVSKAAFRALALVARPDDLPELLRLAIACEDDAARVPADLAVFAVSMKIEPAGQRTAPVLNALRSAPIARARCALMRPLAAIVKANGGCHQGFNTVKAALNDGDAQVREAALRCLADWPDASPAALLLDVAKRDPANRELALRGGIRMAASVASGRDSTPLAVVDWFTQANAVVRTVEEKLMIVSGLGSLKRIEGLQMLQPYLDDPSVQTEAALAVMEIAPALAASEDAAAIRSALQKITASTKDPDLRRRAGKTARSIEPRSTK
jgi:HEAT repeat protein